MTGTNEEIARPPTTDEDYKMLMKRAYEQFAVSVKQTRCASAGDPRLTLCGVSQFRNGCIAKRAESEGPSVLASCLKTYWDDWMTANQALQQEQCYENDKVIAQVPNSTLPTSALWKDLVGKIQSHDCCLLEQKGILASQFHDSPEDPLLLSHLHKVLKRSLAESEPTARESKTIHLQPSNEPSALDSAIKKLDPRFWGPAMVGLGRSTSQTTTSHKPPSVSSSTAQSNVSSETSKMSKDQQNRAASGSRWPSFGQWFKSDSASPNSSSQASTAQKHENIAERPNKMESRTEAAQVDVLSLHSALYDETTETNDHDSVNMNKPIIAWKKESIWLHDGEEPYLLWYTYVSCHPAAKEVCILVAETFSCPHVEQQKAASHRQLSECRL